MSLLAALVVVSFGLFLIGLAGVVYARPAMAERFFESFASSARAHYSEQVVRLVFGASLVLLSPAMWQGRWFELLGWLIVATAVGLLLAPWQWHHRFGQWVIPPVIRHMRIYALFIFAFGALLLYGVFAGYPSAAA